MPGSSFGILIVFAIIAIFTIVLGLAIYQARQAQSFWKGLTIYGFKRISIPDPHLQERIANLTNGGEALDLYSLNHGNYDLYIFQIVRSGQSSDDSFDHALTAAIESPGMDLPKVSLVPDIGEGFLANLAERVIGRILTSELEPVELTDVPEFEKHYALNAAFPLEARAFFTEARLNRLAAYPRNWFIQTEGDLIVFNRMDTGARHPDEEAFIRNLREDAAELYFIFACL